MDEETRRLLERQRGIERQLKVLAKEMTAMSSPITSDYLNIAATMTDLAEELSSIIDKNETIMKQRDSSKNWLRRLVKSSLEKRGFAVTPGKAVRTRVLLAEKGDYLLTVDVRASQFHEGDHNAWFTLNSDSMNEVDFYVLGYLDRNGERYFAVIPSVVMIGIFRTLRPTPKGGYNLRLSGNRDTLTEVTSRTDLSSFIGKVELIG